MVEVFQAERCVLFTGRHARSVGPKTLLLALIFAGLLIGVWMLFKDIGQLVAWNHADGLDILWDSLLGLTLLGILIFIFGVWRFKRQFS